MNYILGKGVAIGDKILTPYGWEKVVEKNEEGIVTDAYTELKYGDEVMGWKKKTK